MHWRSRFGRRSPLIVLGLLAAVGAGCKPDVTREVLFVNDSVTHQSIPYLVQEMNNVQASDSEGRYAPNFGSSIPGIGLLQVPGYSTQPGSDAYWDTHLASLLAHVEPEVIVVELGYNDCGHNLSAYGDEIDDAMVHVPSGTPVHWLTMHDVNDQRTCDETINAALAGATTRWPNLTLFDFAAHMEGHPEWSTDGTHLSTAGQKAYAAWLTDQLDLAYAGS